MTVDHVAKLLTEARSHDTAGRIPQAEQLYRQIIALDGRNAEAWAALGQIAVARRNDDAATAFFGKAIEFAGSEPGHHVSLGLVLERQGRHQDAAFRFQQALGLDPELADAHGNLGRVYGRLGDLVSAAASLEKSVALNPNNAGVLYNLGLTFERQSRFDEALAYYERAREINPKSPEIFNSIATTLFALKRIEESLAAIDQALALAPNYPDAWNNRATALMQAHRLDEALEAYGRVLALSPNHVVTHHNLGNALARAKRIDQALAHFARAQALAPQFADAHWSESTARLLAGDFERGWPKYEWRWQVRPDLARHMHIPQWTGAEDLSGKTILLHAEQGFGDAIQFARYVPLVAARGAARVIIEVPPMMKRLLETLSGWAELYCHGDTLPRTDFQCPFLSLPLAFGTRVETVPANVPYVSVPDDIVARWRDRLSAIRGPRVGIAWSGRFDKLGELHRAIPPEQLAPLLETGATLVSLQKDYRDEDRTWLDAHPQVLDFSADFVDFADTGAVAKAMDLVVTIDTAAAHLAGALACPTRVLLSYMADWRWMLDREDSPWYPTMRLYRQSKINDWTDVIARTAADVRALSA